MHFNANMLDIRIADENELMFIYENVICVYDISSGHFMDYICQLNDFVRYPLLKSLTQRKYQERVPFLYGKYNDIWLVFSEPDHNNFARARGLHLNGPWVGKTQTPKLAGRYTHLYIEPENIIKEDDFKVDISYPNI